MDFAIFRMNADLIASPTILISITRSEFCTYYKRWSRSRWPSISCFSCIHITHCRLCMCCVHCSHIQNFELIFGIWLILFDFLPPCLYAWNTSFISIESTRRWSHALESLIWDTKLQSEKTRKIVYNFVVWKILKYCVNMFIKCWTSLNVWFVYMCPIIT